MRLPAASPTWIVERNPRWRPLRQSWLAQSEAVDHGIASLQWSPRRLTMQARLPETGAVNSATGLNQPTWDLGSVCEVFLQFSAQEYFEVHVTPENQRLQLRWPPGGVQRLRAGSSALAEFLIDDPNWVQSEVTRTTVGWTGQIRFSPESLNLPALKAGMRFRAAVCRYRGRGANAVLSATAPLPVLDFHRPEYWNQALLS